MKHHRWAHTLVTFSVGVVTGWIVSPGPGSSPPTTPSEFTESTHDSALSVPSQYSDWAKDQISGLPSSDVDSTSQSLQNEFTQQAAPLQGTAPDTSEDSNGATAPDETLASLLRNGTLQERITVLTHSLEQDVQVPAEVLRETVQSDPSPEVRLLAFRMYVDAMAGDSDTASAALTLGAYNDDPDVRTEAQARLAEFELLQQASVSQNSLQ